MSNSKRSDIFFEFSSRRYTKQSCIFNSTDKFFFAHKTKRAHSNRLRKNIIANSGRRTSYEPTSYGEIVPRVSLVFHMRRFEIC